jgi:hypothetical protein
VEMNGNMLLVRLFYRSYFWSFGRLKTQTT